jgi:transposase
MTAEKHIRFNQSNTWLRARGGRENTNIHSVIQDDCIYYRTQVGLDLGFDNYVALYNNYTLHL